MVGLTFTREDGGPYRVLALGCHADDIEIGCGGTLLRLAEAYAGLEVLWIVLSAEGERVAEARRSAEAFLAGVAHRTVIVRTFRDGFFPYLGCDVKIFFEELKGDFAPHLIFTHMGSDLHQDHRMVAELTWSTFRNNLILEYEIPKYDGDRGTPNVFCELTEDQCRRKVGMLLEHFPSQRSRHWFTEDLFLSLLRLRGMEARSSTNYAEAFSCRKLVLEPGAPVPEARAGGHPAASGSENGNGGLRTPAQAGRSAGPAEPAQK
jgi:LmbE family N-acetylglucosaminyl deacetylase